MPFPMKTCVVCNEQFELRPGKPGFANRCLPCTEAEQEESVAAQTADKNKLDADERKSIAEANEARRSAMKNLLYRKDS